MGSDGKRTALVVVCGPTASGKTALALEIGDRFRGEIVSADSRQVYRGMDIGTAKASVEERRRVRHHLIDVVDPDEEFSAADFVRLGRRAVAGIAGAGHLPLVAGGTGLYIQLLTEGLVSAPGNDPELRRKLHQLEAAGEPGRLYRQLQQVDPLLADRIAPGDLVRIVRALEVFERTGRRFSELQAEHGFGERPYRLLKIAPALEREELYRRIDQRVEAMLSAGLLDETATLLERGYSPSLKALRTIGYREMILVLQKRLSFEEAVEGIKRQTRRYAKRQLTWLRRDKTIIWVDSSREFVKIQSLIDNFMHQ